ncbi:MAG: DedA family protein [Hyphomicrobiales bacterium]|nr:DedA family protein [Hyphomicrobiales bacterium]
MESVGVPLPGETALVSAAVYAGTTHRMDISLVILAATVGAIIGGSIGFWIGRKAGPPILSRFGGFVGLDERRQKLGQYLFKRHGGKIVFFGRFVAFLRAFAALLAGANRLSPVRFFAYNAAGSIAWATVFGIGGYTLGKQFHRVAGPFGMVMLILAVIAIAVGWRFYKTHEENLLEKAETEMNAQGAV